MRQPMFRNGATTAGCLCEVRKAAAGWLGSGVVLKATTIGWEAVLKQGGWARGFFPVPRSHRVFVRCAPYTVWLIARSVVPRWWSAGLRWCVGMVSKPVQSLWKYFVNALARTVRLMPEDQDGHPSSSPLQCQRASQLPNSHSGFLRAIHFFSPLLVHPPTLRAPASVPLDFEQAHGRVLPEHITALPQWDALHLSFQVTWRTRVRALWFHPITSVAMEETATHRDPVPLEPLFRAFINANNPSTEDLQRLAKPLFACEGLPQLVQESAPEDQDKFVNAADRVCRFSLPARRSS